MTDSVQTNEMKMPSVVVALKTVHGDLEIERFLRVSKSFVHKIRKDLETEIDTEMPVSKGEKENIPHVPFQWEHPNLFIKLRRQLMKTEVNQWGQLQKKVTRVWIDNQKECSWKYSIQILRDEKRSIYIRKIKIKQLKRFQKIFKHSQKSCRSENGWLIIYQTTLPPIFGFLTLQISIYWTIMCGPFWWKRLMNFPITSKTL